ncbi:hypothetical protein K2173_010702 [Erythroxylum novogranatense]|uniref:40S ribosomal protein S6 n=1 Tax=Erythroxylum novogranatense TaxID=1862640 RepID=A0AAV8SQQ6_9ROSI|nr:hypothetical protein K2173_010702 [Erythroxylum novogranatense]
MKFTSLAYATSCLYRILNDCQTKTIRKLSSDALGEEFKGYVFKIMGGCDKQGFPMKGTPCFCGYGRRNRECRRKSVRGCIVSPDLSVLNLVIVKKGENDLPGLTDIEKPRMRGPKRASKIRKLFNLSKNESKYKEKRKPYPRTKSTERVKEKNKYKQIGNHAVEKEEKPNRGQTWSHKKITVSLEDEDAAR